MALSATIHTFEIDLSDTDRGVYVALDLRVARHPSESAPFLISRLLAYLLEHDEGIAFGAGLSTPDEPAIAVRDLTGAMKRWIEVGSATPGQLQKALSTGVPVRVYTYKSPKPWLETLVAARNPRLQEAALFAFEPGFLDALEPTLERRNRWTVVHTEGTLFVTVGEDTIEGSVRRLDWP